VNDQIVARSGDVVDFDGDGVADPGAVLQPFPRPEEGDAPPLRRALVRAASVEEAADLNDLLDAEAYDALVAAG